MYRIGFDAKRVFHNFTGLGNYSRTLLRNLAQARPEWTYFLYTPSPRTHDETRDFLDNPMFQLRQPTQWQKLGWRSYRMTSHFRTDELDLYHGLSHELPYGIRSTKVPSIVTIHDLIFRHYPDQYAWFDRQMYDRKFRYACDKSDLIIAISESTKRDIMDFYGTPADKIRVVYQSCHEGFMVKRTPKVREQTLEKYQLPSAFMLYVGSLIERKNLLGIIEAMHRLPVADRLPLVIVGQGDAYRKRVLALAEQYGLTPLLHFIRPLFSDLPALYQQAQLFLYPSYFEGFGIPILEELYSETPVLTSNRSSLPEAAGAGGYLVAPDDYEAMAAGIQKLLSDSDLCQALIRAGYAHAQQFQGEHLTAQLLKVYETLL
ncbi:MAG: glycosyltransferase family 1 protein [Bacteroidota bacterium]